MKEKSLINRTLSIDETWLTLYMQPERDQARSWSTKDENPSQIVLQSNYQRKRMLILEWIIMVSHIGSFVHLKRP